MTGVQTCALPISGILFTPYTAEALLDAVARALALYGEPAALHRARRAGMAGDFSWTGSARKYVQLYRQANASRRMGTGFNRWLESVERGERQGPAESPRGWEPPGSP